MKRLDIKTQEDTYGGFAWMSLMSLVLEAIMDIIGAVKALDSDGKGSLKTKNSTISWEPKKQEKIAKPSYVY